MESKQTALHAGWQSINSGTQMLHYAKTLCNFKLDPPLREKPGMLMSSKSHQPG